VDYGRKSSEQENAKFRRSLYFIKSGKNGDKISVDMIKSIRPGYGLAPKYYEQVIGSILAQDVAVNTPVTLECIRSKN
jgi:N-acetylneuraminate synthase